MPTEPIALTWVHITSLRAMSHLHGKGALRVTADDIAGVWKEFDLETELPDSLGPDLRKLVDVLYINERESVHPGEFGLVERSYRLHDGVVTHELVVVKYCDLCSMSGIREAAQFDAKNPRSGRWGWMCRQHFNTLGCRLGTGLGQLIRYAEGV